MLLLLLLSDDNERRSGVPALAAPAWKSSNSRQRCHRACWSARAALLLLLLLLVCCCVSSLSLSSFARMAQTFRRCMPLCRRSTVSSNCKAASLLFGAGAFVCFTFKSNEGDRFGLVEDMIFCFLFCRSFSFMAMQRFVPERAGVRLSRTCLDPDSPDSILNFSLLANNFHSFSATNATQSLYAAIVHNTLEYGSRSSIVIINQSLRERAKVDDHEKIMKRPIRILLAHSEGIIVSPLEKGFRQLNSSNAMVVVHEVRRRR